MAKLTTDRRRMAEAVRTLQTCAAAVLVAADWHSPSIAHSVHSTAGRYAGRVVAHQDDYNRDRNPDQAKWEKRWLEEMVDNPHSHPLRALMTGSGMAAVTTIVSYLTRHVSAGPILVGTSLYHEARQLLRESELGSRVVPVPEGDRGAWRDGVAQGPSAVFVDSLGNASGIPVVDVEWMIQLLDRVRRPVFLVLDNTARSVSLQPWARLAAGSFLRLVVFESLTKYAQLGFDRAAGGVIVASTYECEGLDEAREHLGTNIADVVVHQHPSPNRGVLDRRLHRIGRNAQIIADELDRRIADQRLPARIAYPGLRSHPGSKMMAASGFRGGCMSMEPIDPEGCISWSSRFIELALRVAAERGVPLCEGTSFGFDTTRIYLTAATWRHGRPFLRIAAGAEHRAGIDAVAAVLADATTETG